MRAIGMLVNSCISEVITDIDRFLDRAKLDAFQVPELSEFLPSFPHPD